MSDVPEGYKISEVGVIPEDWDAKTFGEVMAGFSSGATPYRGRPEYYKGNIRWITSGELNYNVITDTIEKITENAVRNTNLKIHPKGTFLMAITGLEAEGTRGSCGIVGAESATNQSCMALFPTKELLTEYLFHYYVNYGNSLALEYCQGTKQQSYTAKIVKILPIIVPPTIEEQQAIASALSDVDALITALEQLITKKRNIKQGAMQQLLTGEKRLPGFGGAWEVKKLNKIADVRDGTHESPKYYKNGVIFITSKNIFGGKIDFTDITYISEDDAITINQRSKVDNGDILMSMIGTIGNAVLINFEPDFCIKNVALIKPFNVYGNYLIQFIHSTIFQKHLNENLDGGIQKFISLGGLRELSIPTPAPAEQQAIAKILTDMDAEIESLEQKQDKYKAIKQGMMQELLTGKTRLV